MIAVVAQGMPRGSDEDSQLQEGRSKLGAAAEVAVGGWRKATARLVSSVISFEESEDLLWAKQLLPTSSLGTQAFCDPQLDLSRPT